jgi:alkylation response protein AidB-like acyl-CoA dehydrogenase
VDFAPTPEQAELRQRAAAFVDEELIPLEVEAELAQGRLAPDRIERVRARARELRLVGGNHARELGGEGWSAVEAVLVHEELGRSTNAIWWSVEGGYNVLALGTEAQIDRYLRPTLRGERQDAYAVTERDAGSDPSGIQTTAERAEDGFRIRGEKWFVTSGDVADFYIVMAHATGPGVSGPTLFLIDADTPGITTVDDPPFAHSYPHGHPTLQFDCVVPADAVLGGPAMVGRGDEGQQAWFVEERLHIAARCVGAMRRLLADTVAWTAERRQFGERILDFQGVSFPLADSATACTAARLLTYMAAQSHDDGADPKLVHARASMAKLFASEEAWRCADRCVQAFGGRGYMRTNVAERFLRELRVDRIWEGTSEIQRLIVARALERRGVERTLGSDTRGGAT